MPQKHMLTAMQDLDDCIHVCSLICGKKPENALSANGFKVFAFTHPNVSKSVSESFASKLDI